MIMLRPLRRLVRDFLPARDTPRIVFFHLAKCGGTSINHAIRQGLYAKYPFRNIPIFHLDTFASRRAAEVLGVNEVQHREQLLVYALGLDHLAMLSGHFTLGDAVKRRKTDSDLFITLIREPHKRFLSLYNYNRYKLGDRSVSIDIELEEWLDTKEAFLAATSLTRTFCGDVDFASQQSSGTNVDWESAVSDAVRNLMDFDVVGDLRNIEVFRDKLNKCSGLNVKVGHRMKSPNPGYTQFQGLPSIVQDKINYLCRFDNKVYRGIFGY